MRRTLARAVLLVLFALSAPALAGDHITSASGTPTGACGGDLGGTFPDCTVDDDASATTLLTQAATEDNLKYEVSSNLYFVDVNQDGVHDAGEKYLANSNIFYPSDYTTGSTTGGIQEAIDAAGASALGGVVYIASGIWDITSSAAIIINESQPVHLQGAGRDSTTIRCTAPCTATAVLQILDLDIKIDGILFYTDVANANGVEIGDSSSYISGVQFTNNWVEGDSDGTPAVGSRTGYGIKIIGIENNIVGNKIRFWDTGIYLTGNATGPSNGIRFSANRFTSNDDGLAVSTGAYQANTCDAEQIYVEGSFFQTIYRYGILLPGNTTNNVERCNLKVLHTWFEGMDSGIVVQGGAANFDPDIYSEGNNFTSMTDVAGSADKVDADSVAWGIYADSASNSEIVSIFDQFNSECIEHAGTGDVGYMYDNVGLSGCAPTLASTATLNGRKISIVTSTAVTNSATEAVFDNCDDFTIPQHQAKIGTTFRITMGGIFSSDAVTPQAAIRFRWGTANTDPLLCDLGPTTAALGGATSDGWRAVCECTIRTLGATGTVACVGNGYIPSATAGAEVLWDASNGTTTIATNATKQASGFWDWTTADTDNTASAEYCNAEMVE